MKRRPSAFLLPAALLLWRNVHSADQYEYDVTVDLRNPAVVYAAGYQFSIWRSRLTPRGRTTAGRHLERSLSAP